MSADTRAGAELLEGLSRIAAAAARLILSVRREDLTPREKADLSPVTEADAASEAVILAGLAQLLPDVPVISEEAAGQSKIQAPGQRFLIIDPLDGTREFLAGRDEYTVNIALVEDGAPIAGVIAVPDRGLIWRGLVGGVAERLPFIPTAASGPGSERVAIKTRPRPAIGPRVLVSRSHLDAATVAYVDRLPQPERIGCGSALKFCLIAEGSADLYPRLAPTSEWDVAAGHALLLAAGGGVCRPDGSALHYGQRDFSVPAFIAFGDRSAAPP